MCYNYFMITNRLRSALIAYAVVLFGLTLNNSQASVRYTANKEHTRAHSIFVFAFNTDQRLIQEAKRKHSRNQNKRKWNYKREKRWEHRDERDWGFEMRRHDEWHKPWGNSGFCKRNPRSYSCQRYGAPYSGWSFDFFPH